MTNVQGGRFAQLHWELLASLDQYTDAILIGAASAQPYVFGLEVTR